MLFSHTANARTHSLAFSRALTAEVASRNIRVNTILPGYIDSEMTSGFSETYKTDLTKRIPAGRFGTPEEVASAALFLASNEYLNNCEIRVDGGLSAGTFP